MRGERPCDRRDDDVGIGRAEGLPSFVRLRHVDVPLELELRRLGARAAHRGGDRLPHARELHPLLAGDGGCAARAGGGLDVLDRDARRLGGHDRRQVDGELLRPFARRRRCDDPFGRGRAGRGRRVRPVGGRKRLVRRGRDDRDVGRDGDHRVGLREDAPQEARCSRRHFHGRFVRFDLEQHVALGDRVTFSLVPRDQPPLVHGEAELRHDHVGDAHPVASSRAAVMMSATCGTTPSSSGWAYGIGVSSPARRRGGASRSSNASSAISAAISPP